METIISELPKMEFDLEIENNLKSTQKNWLVTGAAGFIGSHICEFLINNHQRVRGLDNLSTGSMDNLSGVLNHKNFEFFDGTITDLSMCEKALDDIEIVIHQAALGSVPRSIKYPLAAHWANVDGFLNLLTAAKEREIRRFVYASSSAVYGDDQRLPKTEDQIGLPLSPYAVTKRVNELYARNFCDIYGMQTVGLRYFNVFGSRQSAYGPYAAVIPNWMNALISRETVVVHGDGSDTRDYCFVRDVVRANVMAAMVQRESCYGGVFNVASGVRTSLIELLSAMKESLSKEFPYTAAVKHICGPVREGDIPHSWADVSRSKEVLGFFPQYGLLEGLQESVAWYARKN